MPGGLGVHPRDRLDLRVVGGDPGAHEPERRRQLVVEVDLEAHFEQLIGGVEARGSGADDGHTVHVQDHTMPRHEADGEPASSTAFPNARTSDHAAPRPAELERTTRVLLVEDHAKLALTIANGLRRLGIAVDVTFDGEDALAHTALTDYDVVVLDRDLPGIDGDEVCRRLVSAGLDCRVLMLTAAGTVHDRVEGSDSEPTTTSPSRLTPPSWSRASKPSPGAHDPEPRPRSRTAI